MDLLDGLIIVLAISYAVSGYRRGLTWVGPSLLGLFLGILVGAVVAPWISHAVVPPGSSHAQFRAIVATALFLFCVFTLQGLGAMLGLRVRLAVLKTRFVHIDSGGGAIVGAIGVLISAWYVGLTFANSPFALLDQQIQSSMIVRNLYALAPSVPGPVASLDRILTNPNNFSGAFSNLNPSVQIPSNVNTAGVQAATADTFKIVSSITSSDCAGIESGSGWPVNSNHIVTNAHVVAGGQHVHVEDPTGKAYPASVVFFDPQIDLAILYVPTAHLAPLTMATSDPGTQTVGAVIGYPEGGPERVSPAAVRGVENARSQDIYQEKDVTRTIEVLAAVVIPGNSGGPVIDESGKVMGVIFAASTTDNGEGYALAPSQVAGDISAGQNLTQPASTQGCVGG